MERATSSFPVPLSPRISTGCVLCAAFEMIRYLLHLRCTSDDRTETLPRFDLLTQKPVFSCELQMARYPLQQNAEFVDIERLGDVVIRAVTHRLHSRLHR